MLDSKQIAPAFKISSLVSRAGTPTVTAYADNVTTTIQLGGGTANTTTQVRAAAAGTINIGENTVVQTTNLGSTNGASTTTVRAGSGGLSVTATGSTLALAATGANPITFTTNGVANWNISSAGHLLATDNTFDIGAAGATRPRRAHIGTEVIVGAALTISSSVISSAGAMSLNSAGLTLQSTGVNTIQFDTNGTSRWNVASTGHILANTDNTLDIGAAGATRPRTIYARTSFIAQGATNALTVTDGAITQSAGGLTITASGVGVTLNLAGERVQANALPIPVVLSVTSSVSLKTVPGTPPTLYTVPTGRTAIITDCMLSPTTATAAVGDSVAGIGVAAGEDDIFSSQTLTGLNATTQQFKFLSTGVAVKALTGTAIKFGLDTGDTGTDLVADVYLIGYLI